MDSIERCRELKEKWKNHRFQQSSTCVEHDGYKLITTFSPVPRKIVERYILNDKGERLNLSVDQTKTA